MAVAETLSFIGEFASDTLVDTEITNQGWTKKKGLTYWNTVHLGLRWWNGSAWKAYETNLMARMYKAADQSLADSAWVVLTFDSSTYDTNSLIGTNQFVIPTGGDGVYLIICHHSFRQNATGRRLGLIRKNGTASLVVHRTRAETSLPDITEFSTMTTEKLVATDYIEGWSWQNSGGLLGTVGGNGSHWMSITRVGDG